MNVYGKMKNEGKRQTLKKIDGLCERGCKYEKSEYEITADRVEEENMQRRPHMKWYENTEMIMMMDLVLYSIVNNKAEGTYYSNCGTFVVY